MESVDEGVPGRGAQQIAHRAAELRGHLVGLAQRMGGLRPGAGGDALLAQGGEAGGVGGVHDTAEQGDAETGAQLVGGLADRRRAARPLRRGVAEHRLVRPEERGLQSEAEQHERGGQQGGPVVLAHRREHQHRGRGEDEAPADHAPGAEAAQGVRAGGARGHRREGQRQEAQPGLQRGEPQHQLEVLDGDQLEADQRQHGQHDAADGGGEGRAGEHRDVDQRMPAALLPADEEDQERETEGQRAERDRIQEPRPAAQALDAQDDAQHPGRGHQRAQYVPRAVVPAARFGQQPAAERQDHGHQRDVDQEDRAPPEVLDQEAADDRPGGGADRGDRGPHPDGERPLPPVGEDLAQDRQRGGHDHRAADTEKGAGRYQDAGAVGRRGEHRGRAEQRVTDQEHAPSADPVTQRAEENEQRGADEGVGVDDPQEGRAARAQILGEGRNRDMEHGRVECDDEKTEAEDHEDDPAVGVVGGFAQPDSGRGRPGHLRTSR
ncbi:Fe2+ transport system protein B [Streptomyces sp. HCCB10043]|nr:Fe2+ transport system protein B [Streptomyces sp. HCCB10043]